MNIAQLKKPGLYPSKDILLAEGGVFLDDRDQRINKPSETLQAGVNELQALSPGDPRLPTCLMTVSDIFVKRYRETRALKDIKVVIKYCLAAVAGTPAGHADLASMHERLGRAYGNIYLRNRNQDDLELSTKHLLAAVVETATGDPELPSRLKNLGLLFLDRYHQTGGVKNVDYALKYHLAAVSATPQEHSDLPAMHFNVGGAYNLRYKMTGKMEDVDAGIKSFLTAVATSPVGHPKLPKLLQILGMAFHSRYQRTRELKDLDSSVRYISAAVVAMPKGHPDLTSIQQSLGVTYDSRYKMTGNLDNLGVTIQDFLAAVTTMPLGHPTLPHLYHSLSVFFLDRYRRIEYPWDQEAALKYSLASVAATPEGHPDLPHRQQNLGVCYYEKFKRTGGFEDLEAVVSCLLKAVIAIPEGHPALPITWQVLGASYVDRYHTLWKLKDLEAAIVYFLTAEAKAPEGHPGSLDIYHSLGSSYAERYHKLGRPEDLEASIKYWLKAITVTPGGHSTLLSLQNELGISYRNRHSALGNPEDLETAIGYLLTAVAVISEGHPDWHGIYQNLSSCYYARYRWFGDPQDLEVAVSYLLKVVAALPEGHQGLSTAYNGLGVICWETYNRSSNLDDLQCAIKYYLKALVDTPDRHPQLPQIHHNLGVAYQNRFERIENFRDLEVALKHSWAAVTMTRKGHPELSTRHANLGLNYMYSYRATGHQKDLKKALKYNIRALNAIPSTHPDLPQQQVRVAKAYALRYLASSDVGDLDQSYNLYKSALQSQISSPQQLWGIAIDFTYDTGIFTSHQLLEGYVVALDILPSVLWLGSSLSARHDTILAYKIPEVVSRAVITALQDSNTQLAIQFLEQGLSTTHRQTLQLRDEHIMLQTQLPVLSQRLLETSVQLQGSSQRLDPTANYHTLAHERQLVILEIRKQPGFEEFLLASQYSKLCAAAKHGPVIMLNYHHTRSDAIIILSSSASPVHLFLSDVTALDLARHVEKLKSTFTEISIRSREIRYGKPHKVEGLSSDRFLDSLISWMWENVVKHIFSVLNKNGIHDGRLWWCPSGPFTYLPLHAAASIDSHFIQSYTPTLETLIHANQAYETNLTLKSNDLLTAVGVVKTSITLGSWAELPYVKDELNTVIRCFGKQAQQLYNAQATIEGVAHVIQSSNWLHLACHGEQDPADPLKSSLVLYDGKLELGHILNLNLSNAKFVYLSACETATGDSKLANEAMHLAGGFLAAGFLGAIGTTWSMSDAHGPKVAKIVYEAILGEKNIPDVKMAAYGLHLAIQKLRREGAPFYQWMPFIHLGI